MGKIAVRLISLHAAIDSITPDNFFEKQDGNMQKKHENIHTFNLKNLS